MSEPPPSSSPAASSTATTQPAVQAAGLLAHARHELRTPINAILGYSEMMLEDADQQGENDMAAGLQEINLLGKQMQEGINRLLQPPADEEAPVDLTNLAVRAHQQLGPLCAQVLDSCRLLLTEAHKQRRLEAFADDLERIQSAGERFVELLTSTIAPVGASFQLAQDARPASSPAAASAEAPPPALQQPGCSAPAEAPATSIPADFWEQRRGHVLIVDDNKFNRDMLARGLIKQNLHFALAGNGKQALDMLASRAFDLVLLDILMPEMDGFEVLARIKDDANIKHVPVIMISALDQIDSVVRCIEMGAEDYLPKPFDPVLLRARVGACLEKKRFRDQELEYLRNVAAMTEAAGAVESGEFDPQSLDPVAIRTDTLGQLARVFQRMAREVQARVQRLQMQVQKLKVEIDQTRKATQVSEITETGYFKSLQDKAEALRRRKPSTG